MGGPRYNSLERRKRIEHGTTTGADTICSNGLMDEYIYDPLPSVSNLKLLRYGFGDVTKWGNGKNSTVGFLFTISQWIRLPR